MTDRIEEPTAGSTVNACSVPLTVSTIVMRPEPCRLEEDLALFIADSSSSLILLHR